MTGVLLLICVSFAFAAQLAAQAPGKDAAGHKAAANASSAAADAAKGKKVFAAQCSVCHFSASRAKKIGPGLKDLSRRGEYADGKTVDDASLREWIEKGGKDMPGFKDSLNAEQIRDLIAYLKTL
jgi:mono/diheme cytochrome c family protein